ncbi:TetR family transcriptional regulator [Ruania zhangjianzhongii]|uniref:TetR family transcriptional regulator n=1 Tax=Ruania zhangjianzhongii TaxID=2603206 RepID=UPI0011CC2CAD|nr:TetR family transcriptional regulator [Ruania zhangjianzhongii]
MSAAEGLWARSRRAAYAEITQVAMALFLEHGFDNVTIDEIVSAAGISRRSFFRYFGTKEDVVLGDLAGQGAVVRDALEAVPLSVAPWEALDQAIWETESLQEESGVALKIAQMMYSTPSLRARNVEKHLQWHELLEPNIRKRLAMDPDDPDDAAAAAIVASAIACLDAAGKVWARSNGSLDLRDLYQRATRAVRS